MKKFVFLIFPWMILSSLKAQILYDSFADGEFTSAPQWTGNTSAWAIAVNSDVSTGAIGSNTLRLNAPAITQTDYLSSQVPAWGMNQEWGFFLGRRSQAYTGSNQVYFWLYANESNLVSSSVDGYRIAIGDDAGNDEIRLEYIVNGTVNSVLVSSAGAIPNGLTDIGILIRVKRTSAGSWTIFTSSIPASSGSGAVASGIPDSLNASINQATASNNSLVPAGNGFIGVAALHTTGASALTTVEFDQVYFTASANGSTLPVSLLKFSGHREGIHNHLNWSTVFEQNNMGFEVQRSADGFNYIPVGFVPSSAPGGNSTGDLDYSFTDDGAALERQYYRLRQIDNDGRSKLSKVILVSAENSAGISSLRYFPDPAGNILNVVITVPRKDKIEFYITDLSARKILEGTIDAEKGINRIPVNLQSLSKGTYILVLTFSNNFERLACKFVKQR